MLRRAPTCDIRPASIAPVTTSLRPPDALPPDPGLLAAGAALAAQRAALAQVVTRLEGARARVPSARPGDGWRGPAQSAYASSVHDLARGLDEAIQSLRAAQECSGRAAATVAARIG